jgi:tetratricopeptide (TPR) repeat protein
MVGEPLTTDRHSGYLDVPEYQRKLYELLNFYEADVHKLVELATIECNGNRPEGIENEIYSVFHHICRSVFYNGSVKEACQELETAKKSHLQRVQYDAYKIALNAALKKSDKIIEDYEFLLMDSDFRDILPNAVDIFQAIQKIRETIKDAYIEARKYEREGKKVEAIAKYNEAISNIPVLNGKIAEMEDDKRFRVALLSVKQKGEREKQKEKMEKQNAKIAIVGAVISGVAAVASVLGAILGK